MSRKYFRLVFTNIKDENGDRAICGYNKEAPYSPVAISQISEDTIIAWRVSIEEVITKMPYKAILNEWRNDADGLRRHELYRRRVLQLDLLEQLQNLLTYKESQQAPEEEEYTPEMIDGLPADIDELLELYEKNKQSKP